jgi:hypothetical protein
MRTKVFFLSACALAAAGLAGCGPSGGGQAPQAPNQQNLASNVLQLAVGTANIAGQATAGLNVVVTYRQPNGKSGSTLSEPAFTGPFTLAGPAGSPDSAATSATIETGPAPLEIGTSTMKSTAQSTSDPNPAAIPFGTASTFGTEAGAVALGLEPFNYNESSVPYFVAPYTLPLYDTISPDPNAFVSWGGPPAFDLLGNGQSPVGNSNEPAGTGGVSEGLDIFAGIAPAAGTYTLALAIPTNNGVFNTAKTATLPAPGTVLPTLTAPVAPTLDTAGEPTVFSVTLPAGVTEAFLQITDFGPPTGTSCNTSGATNPIFYTLVVTASGTVTLPDTIGPGTPATPSLCTPAQNTTTNTATTDGDSFTAQLIGFDYDEYSLEVHNAAAVKPAPALPAQTDVTISTQSAFTWPNGAPGPSFSAVRHYAAARLLRR